MRKCLINEITKILQNINTTKKWLNIKKEDD